jgi:hypothetical protein
MSQNETFRTEIYWLIYTLAARTRVKNTEAAQNCENKILFKS